MELRAVEYFIAIVEEGSLSKASAKLYITQPTLSHFLAKLEKDLGVSLFFREKNNHLELTSSGQIYYEAAKQISATWRNMLHDIDLYKSSDMQNINLGTGADQLPRMISPCLPLLLERFPNVQIHMVSHVPSILHEMLLDRKLDLAYSAYLDQDQDPRIVHVPMKVSEVDLVVPKGDPLAQYSYQIPGNEDVRIPLSIVKDAPFALISEGGVMRQVVDAYFDTIQFHPTVVASYSFTSSMKYFICQSGLYGLCPRYAHSEELAYIALDPPTYYTCGLYYVKDAPRSPAVKYLFSLLLQQSIDFEF